jgi:hypothetical protein
MLYWVLSLLASILVKVLLMLKWAMGRLELLLIRLFTRREWSDLSPSETNLQLLNYFRVPGRFRRLVAIANAETPRVRAMLGSIGQELKYAKELLQQLKTGLNTYLRFEFGKLITRQAR